MPACAILGETSPCHWKIDKSSEAGTRLSACVTCRAVISLKVSYRAFLGIIKSLDELNSRAFPAATATNQGHCLARINLEIQALQYLSI